MTSTVLMRDTRPASDSSVDYNAWFGEKRPGSVACEKAIKSIKAWMKAAYGKAAIKQTPAGTGMVLLQQTLPTNFEYHVLPTGISKLIHSYSFPHRWEDFSSDEGIEYDVRTAFIACCQHVPVYDPNSAIFDEGSEFMKYKPARYQVKVTVPEHWQHIGLVPERPGPGERWLYPNKPGYTFLAWLDACEVALLQLYEWKYAIRHRMIFSEKPQPMRAFITPIISILERIETHPRYGDEDIKLVRAGIRAIALQTFGRFHAQGGQERAIISPSGVMSVEQTAELNAWAARFYHPEWSASIWAHARARITKAAMAFPQKQILAIHGDSIRFRGDPEIPDTGKVGALRKKG